MVNFRSLCYLFIGDDGFGERKQLFQVERFIEFSLGSRRLLSEAKAERSGAVVRGIEQVIKLAELRHTGMFFDDAAAPIIGAGIAQRAE